MKNWSTLKIHDINNDLEVEIVIFLQYEFESARRFGVHLTLVTILRKMLNRLQFDLVSCSLQDRCQSSN